MEERPGSPSALICYVCKGLLSSPKTLKCLHSFCSDCVDLSLARVDLPDTTHYLCLICKSKTSSKDVFIDEKLNRYLDELRGKRASANSSPSTPSSPASSNSSSAHTPLTSPTPLHHMARPSSPSALYFQESPFKSPSQQSLSLSLDAASYSPRSSPSLIGSTNTFVTSASTGLLPLTFTQTPPSSSISPSSTPFIPKSSTIHQINNNSNNNNNYGSSSNNNSPDISPQLSSSHGSPGGQSRIHNRTSGVSSFSSSSSPYIPASSDAAIKSTNQLQQSISVFLQQCSPVLSVKQGEGDELCRKHGQENLYYCHNPECSTAMCHMCPFADHEGHNVRLLTDLLTRTTTEITELRKALIRNKSYLEIENHVVEGLQTRKSVAEETKARIRRDLEELMEACCAKIDAEAAEHQNKIEVKRQRITMLLTEIDSQEHMSIDPASITSLYEGNRLKSHYIDLMNLIKEWVVPNEHISWPYTVTASSADDKYSFNLMRASNIPYKCTLKFIYAIGGQKKQSVERYSIEQNTWSYVANMRSQRNRISAVFDGDQHIYVFGGEHGQSTNATVERYNILNDSWEDIAPMPRPRSRHATIFDGTRYIYIIGGKESWFTSSVERFDTITHEYMTLAPMRNPRSDLSAVYDGDNYIFAIGGFNGKALDLIEVYDIKANKWRKFTQMSMQRDGPGAIHDGQGNIYVMGGSYGARKISSSLDRLNTEAGRWDSLSPMIKPVDVRNSVVFDGEQSIYVVGGYYTEVLSDVHKYNIGSNTWEYVRPMNEPREGNALVLVSIDVASD
eukprot:gene3955-4580_t